MKNCDIIISSEIYFHTKFQVSSITEGGKMILKTQNRTNYTTLHTELELQLHFSLFEHLFLLT